MIHFIIQSSINCRQDIDEINCRQDIDIIAITWYHHLHVHMLHLILYSINAKKIKICYRQSIHIKYTYIHSNDPFYHSVIH